MTLLHNTDFVFLNTSFNLILKNISLLLSFANHFSFTPSSFFILLEILLCSWLHHLYRHEINRKLYYECEDWSEIWALYVSDIWISECMKWVMNSRSGLQSIHIYVRAPFFCPQSVWIIRTQLTVRCWLWPEERGSDLNVRLGITKNYLWQLLDGLMALLSCS